ncbi:MAG: 30S ribosomal protein S18 [Alphaproteobacteria bacterium]|jgi:small subunit ribosomal protein S18|nr:30S ribosomal protein S18 [Alphaproteobacteria bacterium]
MTTETTNTEATTTEAASTEATAERKDRAPKYTPRLLGKPFFQRKKSCPFSGPRAQNIDYKDTRLLGRFVTEYGKILPCHITGVSRIKQRELAVAIKRSRHLALMPYSDR